MSLVAAGTSRAQWSATEEALLVAPDADAGDFFGASVALEADTAVVGAPLEHHTGSQIPVGAAYVFVRNGAVWTAEQKLTPGPPEPLGFGAVAISGDTIVVGAGDSAYVFVRNGVVWSQVAKLTASDGVSGEGFGVAAISGNTIAVGAPYAHGPGGEDAGAVYVFVRDGAGMTWNEIQKLTAGEGAGAGDHFGYSVAIEADTLLIGARGDSHLGAYAAGSAYVFVRDGSTWIPQQKLVASDAAAEHRFGDAVALSGETALIGAHDAEAAYVFVRSGTTWSEQQKLVASDGRQGDEFGDTVAIAGDTALIGAFVDDHFVFDEGSAYVFARSGTTWEEVLKLTASDAEPGDNFAYGVALAGDTALIGAAEASGAAGSNVGAAYVFLLLPWESYCSAGTSASGCQALLSASGAASATAASGFTLQAGTVEGQKDGLFFFGTSGQQGNSWGNGTSYQCVVPPVVRTQLLTGIGTNGLCDGSFSLDLNAVWINQPQKNPGAGAVVQTQLWYRDPLSTSNQTTSLSDAIELVVAP